MIKDTADQILKLKNCSKKKFKKFKNAKASKIIS